MVYELFLTRLCLFLLEKINMVCCVYGNNLQWVFVCSNNVTIISYEREICLCVRVCLCMCAFTTQLQREKTKHEKKAGKNKQHIFVSIKVAFKITNIRFDSKEKRGTLWLNYNVIRLMLWIQAETIRKKMKYHPLLLSSYAQLVN